MKLDRLRESVSGVHSGRDDDLFPGGHRERQLSRTIRLDRRHFATDRVDSSFDGDDILKGLLNSEVRRVDQRGLSDRDFASDLLLREDREHKRLSGGSALRERRPASVTLEASRPAFGVKGEVTGAGATRASLDFEVRSVEFHRVRIHCCWVVGNEPI